MEGDYIQNTGSNNSNSILDKKKLLLVDDDLDFLEILKTKLENEGFDVDTVSNGNECLQKINQEKYNLIILDVMMPEFDGIDVALEIIKNYPQRNFNFIFLTNLGEENPLLEKNIDEEYAKQIGAYAFISKGEDLDNIVLKIKKIISET